MGSGPEHSSTWGFLWSVAGCSRRRTTPARLRDDEAQREVYVLYGSLFDRFEIRPNAHRSDPALAAALFAITPAGGIANRLRTTGSRDVGLDSGRSLLVPILRATTVKSLWPTLDTIGARGAASVLQRHSTITDAFDGSPYAGVLEGSGDYIQACYHVLFSLVVEELLDSGLLPRLPDPVPEPFGAYIIRGKLF